MVKIQKEATNGIGRAERRKLIRRWKTEGAGLSLKEFARRTGVGDVGYVWAEHKKNS